MNHENDPKNLAKFRHDHDQMKSKSRARDRHVVLFTKVTWPRRSYRRRIEILPSVQSDIKAVRAGTVNNVMKLTMFQ